MVKVKEDMTGWNMWEHGVPGSRLIVVKQTDDLIQPSGKHRAMWYCKCLCGNPNLIPIRGDCIKSGEIKSCGCLNIEKAIERCKKQFKKYNKYDLSGEYGVGWTSNTNREFYFDLEDYDKIKDYCWSETPNSYIFSGSFGRKTLMHRLVMGVDDASKDVDHRYHNKNDNRKCNLRICTRSQNSMNSKDVVGVHWDKSRRKWLATIKKDYKQIFLGRYDNIEDAIAARKEAEEKYFGEYSYDNSMSISI